MPPKNPSHTDAQVWTRTNNCGQVVGAMLGEYFNNWAITPWVIDEENRWLGFPLPYGSGTSSSTFRSLLWGFHLVHSAEYHGQHVDDIINEVVNNRRPTVACVAIKNGNLVPRGTSGSRSHWVLVVGWDSRVILHDPGTRYGRYRAYSVSAFEASWPTIIVTSRPGINSTCFLRWVVFKTTTHQQTFIKIMKLHI